MNSEYGQPEYGGVALEDMEVGDLEFGDMEEGDPQAVSDAEFGDALADAEMGAPMSRRKKWIIGGALLGGAALAGGGLIALAKRKKALARKAAAQRAVAARKASAAPATQDRGFTSRLQTPVPYLGFDNCRVQISPLGDSRRSFPLKLLAGMLDRTEQDSPTTAVVVPDASDAGGVATVVVDAAAIAPVGAMLVPYFIIEFAAPTLSALPAGIITITTLTINSPYLGVLNLLTQGRLVVNVDRVTNRVAIMVVPWNFVNSNPQPTLGLIGAIPVIVAGVPVASAAAITVTANGLPPLTSFMNVIVPGSSHPVTQRFREFIARGKFGAPESMTTAILGGL